MFTPEMIASNPDAVEAMGSEIFTGAGGSQSYDRFKQVYQARTGDQTADPFLGLGDRNVARSYNQSAADYNSALRNARLGIPMATAGPAALGPSAAVSARNGGPSASTLPVATLQPDANETAYYMRNPERQTQGLMQNPAVAEVTQSLGVQQPSPDAAAAVLARTGRMPMPQSYVSNVDDDPESPNYGLDAHVLNNPKFLQLQKLDPSLAAKTYQALTGVSLESANKTTVARRADREKLDDMMVSRLANDLTVDPKTGEFAKRVRVRKSASFMDRFNMGGTTPEYEDQFVPLNPVEKKWVASGAFERKTGINIHDMLGQRAIGGPPTTDPAQASIYQETLKRTGNSRLAELAMKRGTPDPAYLDVTSGAKSMMKGLAQEYPLGPSQILPMSMLTNPQIAIDTMKGIGNTVSNIGSSIWDQIRPHPMTPMPVPQ